ncbi:MAG: preprotein translocase subunit SecG [Gammaproteobacteria bacterium]|nr:preprotein translocase subunit SecG [Gammaproteobacteria bacterium]MBU1603398.1 preprotein translocase subunit SecG [Gammaproteobacteria bacterium]MBU2432918.1 preprotein translocase subunit SecG [Gammaproteobacteria bacterium]MBU2450161.1 preprotein translocase subunit SecG [Gammaproteobacteria bacterium]
MNWFFSLLLTVHILVAIVIIGLVLMQHGKGADMGAAFGSGASGSLFGATGSANFLSRTTGILAAVFFATSLTLAYVASSKPKTTGSVMQEPVQSQTASQPASTAGDVPVAPVDAGSRAKDIPK